MAKELECSRRTVYRDLQTLSLAGVAWHFDPGTKSIRVRAGFQFPNLDALCQAVEAASGKGSGDLRTLTTSLLRDTEQFLSTLQAFRAAIESSA